MGHRALLSTSVLCDETAIATNYSFSLFFTSLLVERPLFPLLSRFSTVSASLTRRLVCHSFEFGAGCFNLTQVRLGRQRAHSIMQVAGDVTNDPAMCLKGSWLQTASLWTF